MKLLTIALLLGTLTAAPVALTGCDRATETQTHTKTDENGRVIEKTSKETRVDDNGNTSTHVEKHVEDR